jgi:hypothetical protein
MQAVPILPAKNPRYLTTDPYLELVKTLTPAQRNALRVLLFDPLFEDELSTALGMYLGTPFNLRRPNWQSERLNNLVDIGFDEDRGATIKRRLQELAEQDS